MKKQFFVIALLMSVLGGCYPDGPDYVEDIDVVYTAYDEAYAFSSKSTYAMPDQIVVGIEIDDGDTTIEYMKSIYSGPILEAIEANMSRYGWTRVDVSSNPDLVLTPAGLTQTTIFYGYWYDWWYGGYWGWYGWYYPPYYSVSSYTTGTLMITLADPDQAADSPVNRSPALWICAANGLLTYSYDLSRVTRSIDEAFTQSPYLKRN